ncbi:MAG TPA: ABC transporter permease subunit/CPBP intramembrane protease [Longimicrobiales bacterium]|nr:ABC transporter permease subunit/CPBP intramembrane protease [Longimicrobiales bacterium]
MRSVWAVARKEVRETLRDWRTLAMMIGVPILLYPVLLVASQQLALFGMRRAEAEVVRIAVIGAAADSVLLRLAGDDRIEVVGVPGAPPDGAAAGSAWLAAAGVVDAAAAGIRAGSLEAVVVLEGNPSDSGTLSAVLLFDDTSDRSRRARTMLRETLDGWGEEMFAARLLAQGLPATFARPLAVADSSLARPDERGGYVLGRFLPMLLVTITLLGAFYPAVDLAAGEKERGTLETLLTSPAPAFSIVLGKFVTVSAIALVAAALNMGSMFLTFRTGLFQLPAEMVLDISIPPTALVWIFALLVPLAALFAAVFLGIAVRSASFKEAQNTLSPLMLLVLLPALLPILPGTELTPALAIVPIAGPALLFRELMSANAGVGMGLLVIGSTAVYALGALWFAADAFGRETILFGGGDLESEPGSRVLRGFGGPRRRGQTPRPVHALIVLGVVAALNLFGAPFLGAALGLERALLASQWLLMLLPAVGFVLLFGYDPIETLSLRRPSARQLGGALLMIAGGTPVAWFLAWLQSQLLPIPEELVEALTRLVSADSFGRMVWLVFVAAITPALAEEFLFRGMLLGSTRNAMSPARAILLNAGIFAIFHLSIVRLLPTAWLGLLLAWVVWRTRSIWTSVTMHALNNSLVVVLASLPAAQDWGGDGTEAPPLILLPLAVLLLGWGVRILQEEKPAGEA